jgi:hypothetical protein
MHDDDQQTPDGGLIVIPCAQCLADGRLHLIDACAECGWPPARDGRCLCSYPEREKWRGRYGEYMTGNLPRLRALFGLDEDEEPPL